MNAKLKMKQQYEGLSKTNKKIADHILANPETFLRMSALEAAKQYQTSSASIIRFTKALGYQGLEEFKIALAKDTTKEEQQIVDTIVSSQDDVETLCRKMEALVDQTNHELFEILDQTILRQAIACLRQSEHIYLLGIGASMLPAYDLYHKLRRINMQAYFEFDAHMATEFFHYISKNDCVVAFSYSGLSKEITYPCEIAKEKGASIIAITRNTPSKLHDMASMVLHVPDKEHLTRIGAISSRFSALEIVDLLYLGIAQKDQNMFEDRLIETSRLVRELKEIS